jgi:RNA polymerase sigma factor (sigma-70 family)
MAALDGLEFSTTDTPERALLRREQTALLQTALAAVPVEARMALTLHYGEIGAIRGISVNTVKTHLRRGRAALRKALRARLMERS